MRLFLVNNLTDNPAVTKVDDNNVYAYMGAVGVSVSLILMAYSICRYCKVAGKLLTPRTYHKLGPTGISAQYPRDKCWKKRCFGNWMLVSLLAREDKLLTQAGLDGYIIMRTFRLSFWIVVLLTIPGIAVLVPFYVFCNGNHQEVSFCRQDARTLHCKNLCFFNATLARNYSAWQAALDDAECSCIDLFTSLNIPDNSPALWVPACMGVYAAGVICWFLWRESREQVTQTFHWAVHNFDHTVNCLVSNSESRNHSLRTHSNTSCTARGGRLLLYGTTSSASE